MKQDLQAFLIVSGPLIPVALIGAFWEDLPVKVQEFLFMAAWLFMFGILVLNATSFLMEML